ncbi:chromate transporter [Spirochaeta dissipatitropha]
MSNSPVSLTRLFKVFFRIGLTTFGGGIAMLSVMRHELHVRNEWMSDSEFWDEVTVATSFPGVIAVNVAFMQGRRLHGWTGAFVGVAGVVLPSFGIMLLIVSLAASHLTHPMVSRFLKGAAAGVTAQLAVTSLIFVKQVWKDRWSLICAVVASLMLFVLGLHPLAALLGGFLLRMVMPMTPAPVSGDGEDTDV